METYYYKMNLLNNKPSSTIWKVKFFGHDGLHDECIWAELEECQEDVGSSFNYTVESWLAELDGIQDIEFITPDEMFLEMI